MAMTAEREPKRISHQERRERREKIAAAIDHGTRKLVADVSQKFGVTIESIRQACFEHGVPFPRTGKRRGRKP